MSRVMKLLFFWGDTGEVCPFEKLYMNLSLFRCEKCWFRIRDFTSSVQILFEGKGRIELLGMIGVFFLFFEGAGGQMML